MCDLTDGRRTCLDCERDWRPGAAGWRRRVRAAAAALMRHGEYSEEEDSMEWLGREAVDVAAAVERGSDAVVAVLEDTAWWTPDDESDARARAVARELGAM